MLKASFALGQEVVVLRAARLPHIQEPIGRGRVTDIVLAPDGNYYLYGLDTGGCLKTARVLRPAGTFNADAGRSV